MEFIEFLTPTVDEKGELIAWTHHSAGHFREDLGNGVDLSMLIIPAGIFQMGSTPRHGNDDERPQHLVTIKSFAMGEHPVTQARWKAVMGKLPSCRFKGEGLPVERVSWSDAQKFCQRLSKKTGRSYGLPGEAQWEYACRAGMMSPFSFGETLTTDLANYNGEHVYRAEPRGIYRHHTTEVGILPPNAFGLRDMHGNVWEWCADNWLDDYSSAPRDTSSYHNKDSRYRVARGGSWHEPPELCRSAARMRVVQSDADEYVGFRVVCEIS
jgi:formylglycine-generating enzyme required for sulfatase activity